MITIIYNILIVMELEKQINNIHHNITKLYDETYGNQIIQTINYIKDGINIEHTHIMVDFIETIIDDDYKQNQINDMKKDINKLKIDNKAKDIKITGLEKDNIKLKEDNIKLNKQIVILTDKINKLESDNNKLRTDNSKFNALVKLHELNALVNNEFKNLYKKKFKKGKYDYIPNIGDFINNPPTEDDTDDYEFWMEFNNKYPRSNDVEFRNIYRQIADDRSINGAHIILNKDDFDILIETVYEEEYNNNKQLYNDYRDWLFMFPA